MDAGTKSTTAALNGAGAQGSTQAENEAKEKVKNRALLLKQRVEENKMKMMQRQKELTNSKRDLEQMFSQLDRSHLSAGLNTTADVDDTKDSKIASLEESVTVLKNEKRGLELKLLELETVQESKDSLELELSELTTTYQHVLSENKRLQSRLEKYHMLEDENDELKTKLDLLSYENSSMKQDADVREATIKTLEASLLKVNQELAISAKSYALASSSVEDFKKQISELTNERQKLQIECEQLQSKLNESVTPQVKVSTLGASKKPARTKRGKGIAVKEDDSPAVPEDSSTHLETQLTLVTSQRNTLEEENEKLKASSRKLTEQLEESQAERHTLQQRIELLMTELNSENGSNDNDLANIRILLQEKENECNTLAAQLSEIQEQKGGSDEELFKLRAKCRDVEYLLSCKEEALRELQLKLDDYSSDTRIQQIEGMVSELKAELVAKEEELQHTSERLSAISAQSAELEHKIDEVDKEKKKLQSECEDLQSRLSVLSSESTATPAAAIKVSHLGSADKKQRSRRGRGRGNAQEAGPAKAEEVRVDDQPAQAELLEYKTKSEELEASLRACEAQIESLNQQVAGLGEQLAASEADKQTLKQRVDLLLAELDSNETQNNDVANMQIILQSKETECTTLAQERDEMGQRLEEAEAELFRLRAQKRDIDYVLNSKDETIQGLQARCDELQQVNAELEAKLDGQTSEKANTVARLQDALHQAREELSDAKQEIACRSETETIHKLEKLCANLNKEIGEKTAEIQQLKEDLQEAEVVFGEKDARLKTVQDELNRMKIAFDAETERSALESELGHAQMDREILLDDLKTHRTQLDECKAAIASLESEVSALQAKVAELTSLNEVTNSQKIAAEEKVNQVGEKFKKLAANYKQKLAVIQQLEGRLEKMKKAAETSDPAGDSRFFQMRLSEAEDELQIMREQLDKLKDTADQLTHTRVALNRAESELQSAAEENRNLREQLDELREVSEQLATTRESLKQAESELIALQDQLLSAREEAQEAVERNQNLQSQLDELREVADELANTRISLSEAQSELALLQDQISSVRGEAHRTVEENHHLHSQLDEVRVVTEELTSTREALNRAESDLTALQDQLQASREEARRAAENNLRLAQQVEELGSANKRLATTEQALNQAELMLQCAADENQNLTEKLEQLEGLEEKLANAQETLRRYKDDLDSAQLQAKQTTEENRTLLQQLDEASEKISQLQILEHECSLNALHVQSMKEHHSAEMEELQLELKAAKEERVQNHHEELVRQLEGQLAEAVSAKDNLLKEMEDMRSYCESSAESAAIMQQQLLNLWQEKEALVERNGQLDAELAKNLEELQQQKEQLASYQKQLDDLRGIQNSHQGNTEQLVYLEEELCKLRQELASRPQNNTELEAQKSSLEQELWQMGGQLSSLQQDIEAKAGEISYLYQQRDNDAARLSQLEEEVNRLRQLPDEQYMNRSSELALRNASIEEESQQLREQLSAAQWDLDSRNRDLSNMQQKQATMEEELAALRQQCADTSSWFNTNMDESAALKSRIADLESQLLDLNNQYAGLYASYGSKVHELTVLEDQVADTRLQRTGFEVRVEELSAEVARLQSTLEERQKELEWLKTTNEGLEEDARAASELFEETKASLVSEIETWKSKIQDLDYLQNELEALKTTNRALEEDAQSASQLFEETKASLLQEVEAWKSRVQDVEHLQASVQELTVERDQALNELESIRLEKSSLETEIQACRNEAEEVTALLRARESENAELVQRIETAQVTIREKEQTSCDVKEIGLLRMNLADLSAERDDLSYQLEDYQAQCSSLETKLTEADEVRSILETTVSYLESKVSELQSEISTAAAGNEARLAVLEEERDRLTSRLNEAESLEQELSSMRLKVEDAERMVKESEAALTEARQYGNGMLRRTEELQQHLNDSARCLSEEQQKHRSTMDERDELYARIEAAEALKQELASLRLALEDSNAALMDARSEGEESSSRADELQQQLSEERQKCQLIQQELDQLSARLGDASLVENTLADARSAENAALSRAEELQQQLNHSLGRLSDEQQRYQLIINERDALSVRLSEVEQERAALSQQTLALRDEVERLSSATQVQTTDYEKLRAEVNQLKHQADEVSHLRVKLFDAMSEKEELESTVQALEEEVEPLRVDLEASRSSSVVLNARCADLDMERNLLLEKCMELRDGQAALEAKCSDLERLRADVEAENLKLKSRLEEAVHSSQASETGLAELAQLRIAVVDLTAERDDMEEKLAEAEEKLAELASLRITNSELSMELEEALAKVQVVDDQRAEEVAEMKRQLLEATSKLNAQEQHMDRISVERDHLQQAVSRLESKTEQTLVLGDNGTTENTAIFEKRIAELESELHETKIKAAKSFRQVKLLKNELAKQKEASRTTKEAGGDDYFNFAVEEELRKQVNDAEKSLADKVKEIERLLARIDTLEGANERFMQAKEWQDNEVAMLQQRIRELQSQVSSLEWDHADTSVKETENSSPVVTSETGSSPPADQIAALESTISQLTDDNEHFQDMLDELKAERMATEAELKTRIAALQADLAEKSRLLDEISLQVDNKDRLLADAYESVSQLRKQVMQLSESGGTSSAIEDLKRENENLVDMIRQLSTTGTLDAATVQRLRDEIDQTNFGQQPDHIFLPSSSSEAGELAAIDWQSAFNDLQIEVEYLRSQNAALLGRLQEAGIAWDEEGVELTDEGDRMEIVRSQLDNALRTVHERDMRCQELTWEITKLLEERDALQLRLSNALRQNHEMQEELKEFTTTATQSDIAAKLKELKQINYSLDVQLRREQEERQKIERQLMALHGTRVSSTGLYGSSSRRRERSTTDGSTPEPDLNSSQESLGTGQVLSEWLKGKGSSTVQHV